VSLFSRFWRRNSDDAVHRDYREVNFLAVDLEMSSLDPKHGQIISIGFVPISQGAIEPGLGRHLLISDHAGVGQSAAIHGIRDCDSEFGMPLQTALQLLQAASKNRTLVFHFAQLDLGFLQAVGWNLSRSQVIDTLTIEQQRLQRRAVAHTSDTLKLYQCRRRYHLPDYPAHNSFADALATAELFLAQAAHMRGSKKLTLNDLLAASAP